MFLADLYFELARRRVTLAMTPGQIDALIGFPVLEVPGVKEQLKKYNHDPTAVQPAPGTDNDSPPGWREFAAKLAVPYGKGALPEPVEFLQGTEGFESGKDSDWMPLDGHPGYSVLVLEDDWLQFLTLRAYLWGFDPALVDVGDGLRGKKFHVTAVYREPLQMDEVWRRFIESAGKFVERTVSRKVWVARYDGRALRHWRTVKPLDARHLGHPSAALGGGNEGVRLTARRLLDDLEQAVNRGKRGESLQREGIVIVDETGLPAAPAEGRTWTSVRLCSSYAFWHQPEGIELAKTWFHDNFGITFHEEMRDVVIHVLQAAGGEAR
jgi:hypothetical protein